MVTCKCGSINVDIKNLDYARVKPEGAPAAKYTGRHDSFYCYDCRSQWKSEPEDWKVYNEYQSLVNKNRVIAHDMPADGSYQSQEMGTPEEYDRQKELAKELVTSYKHLLNLEAGVWFDIEQDLKNL